MILTRIDDHFPKVSDHGTGRLIESKIPAQFIHACDALPYGIKGLAPPPRIVLLVSSVNTMENGHELLEGVLLQLFASLELGIPRRRLVVSGLDGGSGNC